MGFPFSLLPATDLSLLTNWTSAFTCTHNGGDDLLLAAY